VLKRSSVEVDQSNRQIDVPVQKHGTDASTDPTGGTRHHNCPVSQAGPLFLGGSQQRR
jgi:hypothetical protein